MKTENVPQIVPLDGSWDFTYCQDTGGNNPPAIPAEKQFEAKMAVPACWDDQIESFRSAPFWPKVQLDPDHKPIEFPIDSEFCPDSSLPFIVGVGWYKKRFELPEQCRTGLVTLCIGGVRLEAWVWLNGQFIGYHLGHSTAFEMPLQKAVINGAENELIIAVANTSRDRLGCDLRGYKGYTGGIYRPVYLKITGETKIADLYLQPAENNSQINWTAELKGCISEKDLTINWSVKQPGTAKNFKNGTADVSGGTATWQTDNCGMQPWSDNEPNLYEIEVKLCYGDTVLDTVTQNFGLRTIKCNETSLSLNGRPVFLRGITEHCYFPLTCTPPPDLESYRLIITKLKESGFNWLRCHTWVPSEEYMQVADELGMMIQVEPPVGFGEKEWINIIRACRKHPSVVIYCCGNEEFLDEAKIKLLKKFARLCKLHAPDALFNPQEALRGIEYVWTPTDLGEPVCEKPFRHNPARLKALREFSDVFGHYSWGYLSYISNKGNWRGLNKRIATYQRPCLAHEICIHGSYLDVSLEKRYKNLRIGTDLFVQTRKNLEKLGLLNKASLYYKNSSAWGRSLRKHTIEMVRKCKYLTGYDFLGATDDHNHAWGYTAGMMNEFYEFKPGNSAKETLKYNAESILLLDHTNQRNLTAGDKYEFDIMASLFGTDALSKATVTWSLTDGKNNYADGQIQVNNVPNGSAEKLGTISFTAPNLSSPTKLALQANLKGGEYEIENDWDFWAFPKSSNLGKNLKSLEKDYGNELKIVSVIDEAALKHLENGGSIILLGPGPFPTLPTGFQIGLPGRTGGNLATVIYDHPITKKFPHEGYCDWQFYSMLEDGCAVVFNDIDIPFAPTIEIVSTFKLIYKQSTLFEFAVGDGKLLVCTLNLEKNDPAAMYLLETIVNYAQDDDFRPSTNIDMNCFKRVINTKYGPYSIPQTDMAFDPNAQL